METREEELLPPVLFFSYLITYSWHLPSASPCLSLTCLSFSLSSCPHNPSPLSSLSFLQPQQQPPLPSATVPSSMGAHWSVRAPLPSPLLLLFLIFIIIHHANGSDSDTLIDFKDSLINGKNLTTWIPTISPCDNNTANWEGLVCTNGSVSGIKLDGRRLQGNIDTYILAQLRSLVTISFMNNSLGGNFPDFAMLYGIQEIFLSDNRFYGEIPANAFKGLDWLQKLYLANNRLLGQIPRVLTTLPSLKELMLQNNHLEGVIPNFYQGKLTLANFSSNHLHGRIPKSLQHFPASHFYDNDPRLCGAPLGECQNTSLSIAMIAVIASVVATSLAAVLFAVVVICRHHHHHQQDRDSMVLAVSKNTREKGGSSKKADGSKKLTFLTDEIEESFDLSDLLKASAEVLGSGMFGSSYKTAINGGKVMVVKRFKLMNNVGKEEFCEHIRRLGRLSHPNILTPVAFYYRKDEKLLVSDYVDNISLSHHLHGNQLSSGIRSPNWPARLKIVKGVVKGLQNLYIKLPSLIVPHGHLKSSNVLLNKNYEPLLTDYGLVPVTNPELARDLMMVYKSPEYKQLGRISKRTDIWCLGILILEVMTGKIPANTLHQSKGNDSDLMDFINSVADQELTIDVFDKEMTVSDKSNAGEMMKLLKIGLSCCERDAQKRMDINQVVERIDEVKEKDGIEDDYYSTYSGSEQDKQSSKGLYDDLAN